ncbi:hypothetical protein [Legionella sp. 227]
MTRQNQTLQAASIKAHRDKASVFLNNLDYFILVGTQGSIDNSL